MVAAIVYQKRPTSRMNEELDDKCRIEAQQSWNREVKAIQENSSALFQSANTAKLYPSEILHGSRFIMAAARLMKWL